MEGSTAYNKNRSPVQSLCSVRSRQSLTTARLEIPFTGDFNSDAIGYLLIYRLLHNNTKIIYPNYF